jgi:hypothetical protein
MSKLRVESFTISLDGFVARQCQKLVGMAHPLRRMVRVRPLVYPVPLV